MPYPPLYAPALRTLAAHDQAAAIRVLEIPLFSYRCGPTAAAVHASDKRFRFLLAGNRSGKTRALVVEAIRAATGFHPHGREKPLNAWVCTDTWDNIGQIFYANHFQPLLKGIPHEIAWHNAGMGVPKLIRFEEATIRFKAYEQGREGFQGAGVPRVFFSEPFPQDVFEEATSRIGAGYKFRFMAEYCPLEPMAVEERLLNPPDSWGVWSMPIDENRKSAGGFIEDSEIDALIESWPVETMPARRYGKTISWQGTIFQTFDPHIHVVSEERERDWLKFEPGWGHCFRGIDWGGANPMALVWGMRCDALNGDWYIFDEYFWENRVKGQRSLEDHAKAVLEIDAKWGRVAERTWADHDPTDAFEFGRHGVSSWPADKKNGLHPSIELIQSLLKVRGDIGRARLYIAARCKNLIREMRTYRHRKGSQGVNPANPKEDPLDIDNHCISALRYLLYSEESMVHRGFGPPVVMGAENRRVF